MSHMPAVPAPLVSVVIVNYNGGGYLLDSVAAVLDSSVPIELFVMDNGSRDGSVRALQRVQAGEPRLRIIENGANLGFSRANNIALKEVRGEFVLLLNPDCVVQPDTLERMVEVLRADPTAGMAGCLIRNPDGSEQAGCRRAIPSPWTGLVRLLNLNRFLSGGERFNRVDLLHQPLPREPVYVEAISGAFILVRRSAVEQVGPMDEGYFLHCEDLDWCQSFRDAGWKVLFVPQVEIVHHKGACSNRRPLFVLWHKHKGMVRFYRKFLGQRYSAPFNLLVALGVWVRFALTVPLAVVSRLRGGGSELVPVTLPMPEPVPAVRLPELRDRPVLVTGGSGFVGRHLVAGLLRQGARVNVLTRTPERYRDLWSGSGVHLLAGDLERPASLADACAGVEILFHLASHAHLLEAGPGEAERHRAVTERGTGALLQAAVKAGVGMFVFASSVKAMSEGDERCLDERSEPVPESDYGRAKLAAERQVLEAGRAHGMRVALLRLPMVYGSGNKGNLPLMIRAIERRRFPPLPRVPNRRSMLHVEDAVQAMLLAAVRPRAAGQVYLVTDGRSYSTHELYRHIALSLGRRPPRWAVPLVLLRAAAAVGDLGRRLGLPVPLDSEKLRKLLGSACYSSEKIRRELGYMPRYDLERSLPEIVAAMRREGSLRPVSDVQAPEPFADASAHQPGAGGQPAHHAGRR